MPYDTRPRYTGLGAESARVTGPVRAASSATINATLATVAAAPRWISPRWMCGVAISTSAAMLTPPNTAIPVE